MRTCWVVFVALVLSAVGGCGAEADGDGADTWPKSAQRGHASALADFEAAAADALRLFQGIENQNDALAAKAEIESMIVRFEDLERRARQLDRVPPAGHERLLAMTRAADAAQVALLDGIDTWKLEHRDLRVTVMRETVRLRSAVLGVLGAFEQRPMYRALDAQRAQQAASDEMRRRERARPDRDRRGVSRTQPFEQRQAALVERLGVANVLTLRLEGMPAGMPVSETVRLVQDRLQRAGSFTGAHAGHGGGGVHRIAIECTIPINAAPTALDLGTVVSTDPSRRSLVIRVDPAKLDG